MKKFYVGRKFDLSREIISTNETPTKNIFGHKYIYCLGPFDTKDAAEYMAGPGWNNPKCKTIKDAEKLIKELKDKAA
jgi:hypothetical protein